MSQTWKYMNNFGKGLFIGGSIMIIAGMAGIFMANELLFRESIMCFGLGWYYLSWATTDNRMNTDYVKSLVAKATNGA